MDKKALAKAKLEARRLRVSTVRRKVAIFAASLTLAFSGLIVGLNGIPLLFGGSAQPATKVTQTDGAEQQAGATIVAVASGLIFGQDEEQSKGGFFSTGNPRSGNGSSNSPSVTTSQS